MKHVSIPTAGVTPAISTPLVQKPKRGFFASILAALHHSRRLQARRVLRQHRELISRCEQRTAFLSPNPENRGHVDQ